MALEIKVDVSREAQGAPAEVLRRAAALQGPRLNTQVGRGVANLFKEYFFRLDNERANKLGGQRTHFYSDAAKATSSAGDATGATVTVSQLGIRQRLEGGRIEPRNGSKYLTIPARAEAYGRRAREFKGLVFVRTSRGGMLVASEDLKRGKRKLGHLQEGLVYYWLVPFVVQKPDPTVLPREELIRATIAGVVQMAWQNARRPS